MSQNHQNVKAITLQKSPFTLKNCTQKQAQQLKVLQVGDRVTVDLCGETLPGIVIEPLIGPEDVQANRGAEFLIVGDRTWRVNWQNSDLLACSPRQFVKIDGGAK